MLLHFYLNYILISSDNWLAIFNHKSASNSFFFAWTPLSNCQLYKSNSFLFPSQLSAGLATLAVWPFTVVIIS